MTDEQKIFIVNELCKSMENASKYIEMINSTGLCHLLKDPKMTGVNAYSYMAGYTDAIKRAFEIIKEVWDERT